VVTFNKTNLTRPSIVVTNAAGQIVRQVAAASIQEGQATIDLQGLPKGVYYVTLNDGKKQTTKKLLVL
jgi:hypothetical protein